MKVVLKGLKQIDGYSGEMTYFETEYNGIPEACAMWAFGYKHCFLEDCHLFYAENGCEVPDIITDKYYDRYYYGRYLFDENGEEIGRQSWNILHIQLFYPSFNPENPQICQRKSAILIKNLK